MRRAGQKCCKTLAENRAHYLTKAKPCLGVYIKGGNLENDLLPGVDHLFVVLSFCFKQAQQANVDVYIMRPLMLHIEV